MAALRALVAADPRPSARHEAVRAVMEQLSTEPLENLERIEWMASILVSVDRSVVTEMQPLFRTRIYSVLPRIAQLCLPLCIAVLDVLEIGVNDPDMFRTALVGEEYILRALALRAGEANTVSGDDGAEEPGDGPVGSEPVDGIEEQN